MSWANPGEPINRHISGALSTTSWRLDAGGRSSAPMAASVGGDTDGARVDRIDAPIRYLNGVTGGAVL